MICQRGLVCNSHNGDLLVELPPCLGLLLVFIKGQPQPAFIALHCLALSCLALHIEIGDERYVVPAPKFGVGHPPCILLEISHPVDFPNWHNMQV